MRLFQVRLRTSRAPCDSLLGARLAGVRFPLTAPAEREIQRHVYEYADELKGLGLAPERVVIAVKYAANQAGIHATVVHLTNPRRLLDGKDKLLVDMVGWCIERYFGDAPNRNGEDGSGPV